MNREKSLRHVARVDEFLDLRTEVVLHLKSINVELFEHSEGVMRGSDRGRNQPKDGRCPDYIRKPVSASQSMQTSKKGSRKSSTHPRRPRGR